MYHSTYKTTLEIYNLEELYHKSRNQSGYFMEN